MRNDIPLYFQHEQLVLAAVSHEGSMSRRAATILIVHFGFRFCFRRLKLERERELAKFDENRRAVWETSTLFLPATIRLI